MTLHATHSLLLLACVLQAAAQAPRWRHVADYTDTRSMIAVDGLLATASTRGGAFFHPMTGEWNHLSIPQGMLAIDLVDVCSDGTGMLFWAGADASVSAHDLRDGAWSRGFFEFREHPQIHEIHDLWGGGGTVLVSHSIGLTCFDYLAESDEFLVNWSLNTLGGFQQQSAVLAAAGFEGWLVAATPEGLAWGSGFPGQPATFQNMAAPGDLSTVSKAWLAPGLARIYALLSDPQGRAWAGSMGADGQWRQEWTGLAAPLALAADAGHWAMAVANGDGCALLLDGDPDPVALPQRVGGLSYLDGLLWAALLPGAEGGGIIPLEDGLPADPIRPDLPGAEEFVDLAFAPDGSLWAVGVATNSTRNGLFHLPLEGAWEDWKLGAEFFGNFPTSVACDRHGGVWFGSWGRGCGRLQPDAPAGSGPRRQAGGPLKSDRGSRTLELMLPQVMKFSHDSGPAHRMVGFSNAQVGDGPTFPLVSDIEEDAAGNIWIVNHQALDDSCLVVVPATWFADTSTAFARHVFAQIDMRFPWSILPTQGLGVWAGVAGKDSRDDTKRLVQLSPRGLPVSRLSEWRLDVHTLADAAWNFGLSAPGTISGLAADASGSLWIGTSDGFYVGGIYGSQAQFSRVQFIEGLLSEELGSLDVDGRGRVWLGSDKGLSVYQPERAAFLDPVVVGELNSLLRRVDNHRLYKVCLDQRTGAVWAAGNLGLFVSDTGARNYGTGPSGRARMYPNPFRPDGTNRARLLPEGLANDATVSIYDADGHSLRRLTLLEAEEGWDGRSDDGRLVGSGVYLVLVTSGGGTAEGKIAVIR